MRPRRPSDPSPSQTQATAGADRGSRAGFPGDHAIRPDQLASADPYELARGRLVQRHPSTGLGSVKAHLAASIAGWDPLVKQAGVDVGYAPRPTVLRAPDVAIGNVPDEPGWIGGGPELGIELSDATRDRAELEKKIADLLDAGTRMFWVIRLDGPRRVDVYEPGKRTRSVPAGQMLR